MKATSGAFQVPDEIGVIRAARVWYGRKVAGNLAVLTSVGGQSIKWPRHRPMHAKCEANYFNGGWIRLYYTTGTGTEAVSGKHVPPEKDCNCGLWAMVDPLQLPLSVDYTEGALVYGVVELWGRVVPGEDGWRGEHARPVALIQRDGKRVSGLELAVGRSYSIPVLDEWPALTPPSPLDPPPSIELPDETEVVKYGHREDSETIPDRTDTGVVTDLGASTPVSILSDYGTFSYRTAQQNARARIEARIKAEVDKQMRWEDEE